MRKFLILIVGCMTMTSCGILGMMNRNYADPVYGGSSAVPGGSALVQGQPGGPELLMNSRLMRSVTRHLQATEDHGTGLYGYLNEFGLWAIAPTYEYARDFDDDLGLAAVRFPGGRCGAIDATGRLVIASNFESIYNVEEAMRSILKGRYVGIDLWVMQDRATGLYGFLDFYGNWFIPPKYLYAADMSSEGFAVVKVEEGKWGVIDRAERMVVQPNFRSRYDAQDALNALLRR